MVLCRRMNVFSNAFYMRIRGRTGAVTSSLGEKNVKDVLDAIEDGIAFVEKHAENNSFKLLYFEYWAYQYAMLLGLANELRNSDCYEAIYARLKKLKWLLKYDHEKKVRAVHLAVSVIGLRAVMNVLRLYYKL